MQQSTIGELQYLARIINTPEHIMKSLLGIVVAAFCITALGFAQQKDDPKCKDHPLFTRMPESWIHSCMEKEFNAHSFLVAQGKKTTVEGRYWKLNYYPQATAVSRPSELQILRNFENAIKKQGGTVVYAEKSRETFTLAKGGKEVWIEVWAEFTGKYGFIIVEKQAMEQDIVANAAYFAEGIKTNGHVAVDGINFETGKAVLKPESMAAISEIATLLAKDPGLNVFVVGHTDNTGDLATNMKLSQDRASAVMQSLIGTHGINAARLSSFGAGPYAPVASNDTEEGKTKNRRVELVKR